MLDLKSRRAIYFKGVLFLILGLMAAGLLISLTMSWRVVTLLVICIWSFCRFYYFAFYVIQNYVDEQFRYRGLIDFIWYYLARRSSKTDSENSKNS